MGSKIETAFRSTYYDETTDATIENFFFEKTIKQLITNVSNYIDGLIENVKSFALQITQSIL